ncbi:hypothetical protein [Methylobrevis pamukkalensis]|uniref:Uncharacterized protein n=1 Tax=Methylobrevis pamukkalensis TaxID=1439726 RepID=A0A1E3H6R5_9HYPH|nr:hypothetical protein [Methylobrevis pamukkalensis]ODN71191.1 hypothetical protein A6302_01480 [Methylobrevis pamukkalensis]
MKFETLVALAHSIGAAIRLDPRRDLETGDYIVTASLVTETGAGQTADYSVIETHVVAISEDR